MDHRRRRPEEPILRAILRGLVTRNPEASMVGMVRAFPMTWWATWASIIYTGGLGLIYSLSGVQRFSSPAFDSARQLVHPQSLGEPMRAWGLVFVVLATAEFLALRRSVFVLRLLLRAGATIFLFYAFLFLKSALEDPRASYGGAWLYLYVAVIHLAIAQTITLIMRGART